MKKKWIVNLWPRVSLFVWLVVKVSILTNENLRLCGVQGPSQLCLCYQEEESMGHLRDKCTFVVTIWEKGVMGFRRRDRKQGQPAQTLKEWLPKAIKNPIIISMWGAFLGMAMWCLWNEQKARIFRDQHRDSKAVWNMVKDNMLSSIWSMQWHDQDKIIHREEAQIAASWGLDSYLMEGLRR